MGKRFLQVLNFCQYKEHPLSLSLVRARKGSERSCFRHEREHKKEDSVMVFWPYFAADLLCI